MKALVILMALVSGGAMAATIEVHTPKGAKDAYALLGVAKQCDLRAKLTFDQEVEIKALADHYQSEVKAIDPSYNYNLSLAYAASGELYGIAPGSKGEPTYEQCAKILKVTK